MLNCNYIEIVIIYLITQVILTFSSLVENQCPSTLDFACPASGQCIPKSKRCDGSIDCLDESDEWDCDLYLCEPPFWFRCKNNECVSHAYVCDTENDCGDFSDENNCTSKIAPQTLPKACVKGQWQCADRLCILDEWVCNGKTDCLDGSDETVGCEHIKCDDGFKCTNGQCIFKKWKCDGIKDCKDGSDELNCSTPTKPEDCKLDKGLAFCNDTCINLTTFCNSSTHCTNADDRYILCRNNNRTCEGLPCTHGCVMTQYGAKCVCPQGYQLNNNHFNCTDINECKTYGACDQKCENTPGSFICHCDRSYKLQPDKKTCKVEESEPLMVFSSKTEIRGYYLNSGLYFPIAKNLTQSIGVAFDGRYVYWTEIMVGHESIVRSLEDGSHRQVLVTSGLDTPEDLAVDWITGNIYFTDAEMKHIGVCTNDGMYCTVLVNQDVQNPRSIVLHPQKGTMYWTDWGKRPEIARAKMDGTEDISFVANGIFWPNGLAIDIPNERLYWVDAKIMTLQSIKLDGSSRRIILENIVKHPYALAVFENQVYWSDWSTYTIESCEKFTGKNHNILVKQKEHIYGIHIYHPALQPNTRNPCLMKMCSHMCLLSGSGYACACPENKILGSDKHTCKTATTDQVLVVSTNNMLMIILHQQLGKQNLTVLPVTVRNATALAYSGRSNVLFVSEATSRSIIAIDIRNGLRDSVMREKSVDHIASMDFDNVGNNIYWCDSVRTTVEVLNLNSMSRTILLSDMVGETPISIALVPTEGVMFVAFQRGNQIAHIDRMKMDGSNRAHVIEDHLMGPVHLLYDATLHRIFWADSGTGIMESTSTEGDDRHSFQSFHQTPVTIASLNKNIFWANHNSKKLFWADKMTGENIKNMELDIKTSISNIISISPRKVESHPCLIDNGNCSHLCIPNYKTAVCLCPFGLKLESDKKTCSKSNYCEINEFYCQESNFCIEHEKRCNNFKDCVYGEDERNCTEHKTCEHDHFQCTNKDCIKKELVCDTRYDCADKSDEENCAFAINNSTCPLINHFRCTNGVCIENTHVCDTRNNCEDGSDEQDCKNFVCTSDQFKCSVGSCIPKKWECDQEYDCPDKSDEHKNCSNNLCGDPYFQCNNGLCIEASLKCNKEDDCGDLSDEDVCGDGRMSNSCRSSEYNCWKNNTCLPIRFRCNRINDCPQGEDEENCTYCSLDQFECDNRRCIDKQWLCDHTDDCGDGSDESVHVCIHQRETIPETSCDKKYQCKNGKCIEKSLVCNEANDCGDGSDESGACSTACLKNSNPCSQICRKTPAGPQCECDKGFTLRGDGRTCTDLKECLLEPPLCSQICREAHGSYECKCHDGYSLRSDGTSCKSAGESVSFIFASSNEISQLIPKNYTLRLLYNDDDEHITGLGVSIEEGYVYFSTEHSGTLHRINIHHNTREYINNLGRPEKLSVDWLTQNIYFVDKSFPHSSIKLCNFDQKTCAHIIHTGVSNNVTSITVDSINKYLFYATHSSHVLGSYGTFIYKCNLDGTNLQKLVKLESDEVSGLSFNPFTKQIYYMHKSGNIYKTTQEEQNPLKIITNLTDPATLLMFEEHLYFYTPMGYITRCPLYVQYQACISYKMHRSFSNLFVVHQSSIQPQAPNICKNYCTNLCVPKNNKTECICNQNSDSEDRHCENVEVNLIHYSSGTNQFGTSKRKLPENDSSSSQTTAIVIGVMVIITVLVTGMYCYIQKKQSGSFNITMRFQNPLYGCQPEVPQERVLNPGEHEYYNPLENHANQLKQSQFLSNKLVP